jgi:LDH2 family malate/lactate/ureidoglycolate dehydrogenase
VRIPGERSEAIHGERTASGIPLHPNLWRELTAIEAELGVAAPSPLSGDR